MNTHIADRDGVSAFLVLAISDLEKEIDKADSTLPKKYQGSYSKEIHQVANGLSERIKNTYWSFHYSNALEIMQELGPSIRFLNDAASEYHKAIQRVHDACRLLEIEEKTVKLPDITPVPSTFEEVMQKMNMGHPRLLKAMLLANTGAVYVKKGVDLVCDTTVTRSTCAGIAKAAGYVGDFLSEVIPDAVREGMTNAEKGISAYFAKTGIPPKVTEETIGNLLAAGGTLMTGFGGKAVVSSLVKRSKKLAVVPTKDRKMKPHPHLRELVPHLSGVPKLPNFTQRALLLVTETLRRLRQSYVDRGLRLGNPSVLMIGGQRVRLVVDSRYPWLEEGVAAVYNKPILENPYLVWSALRSSSQQKQYLPYHVSVRAEKQGRTIAVTTTLPPKGLPANWMKFVEKALVHRVQMTNLGTSGKSFIKMNLPYMLVDSDTIFFVLPSNGSASSDLFLKGLLGGNYPIISYTNGVFWQERIMLVYEEMAALTLATGRTKMHITSHPSWAMGYVFEKSKTDVAGNVFSFLYEHAEEWPAFEINL